MAFAVSFPTTGPCPSPDELASWLKERGEPFEVEGPDTVQLRALPVRFVLTPGQHALQAQIDVTSTTPLSRLVDLLFAVSVRAGADVRLTGEGEMTRPALWMHLADEQDRLRIAESLQRAAEHGTREEVTKRLWAIVASLRPGCDDRWDADRQRIVQLLEVGEPDGISLEEARWHVDDPKPGDVIPVPVRGFLHILAWRWLSETYPGIAEASHTGH